jgi:hypothetical protein
MTRPVSMWGQPLLSLAVAGVAYGALLFGAVAYGLYVVTRRPEASPGDDEPADSRWP